MADPDPTLLAELEQHLTDHTPSCNARTDHLMRRAAWALGAPRPAHVGGNAEDCSGCEGTNPPYPFLCPGPPTPAPVSSPPTDQTADRAYTDPAQLTRVLAAHTDSLTVTIEGFTGLAVSSLQPGLQRTLSFLKLYKEQLLTGQWTAEVRRLLDQLAAGARQQADTETPDGCTHQGQHPGFTCAEADQTRPFWDSRWAESSAPAPVRQPAADDTNEEQNPAGASPAPPIEPCPPGCIACATDESHDPAPDGSGQP